MLLGVVMGLTMESMGVGGGKMCNHPWHDVMFPHTNHLPRMWHAILVVWGLV